MDMRRAEFWGDLLDVVDARVAESAEAATIRALEKMAAARAAFEARFGSLGSDVRGALLLGIAASYAPSKYDQALLDCPACSTPALVDAAISVDWEPDWDYADGESYIAGFYPDVTIFPRTLKCRACGLNLEGEPELAAARVPRSWKRTTFLSPPTRAGTISEARTAARSPAVRGPWRQNPSPVTRAAHRTGATAHGLSRHPRLPSRRGARGRRTETAQTAGVAECGNYDRATSVAGAWHYGPRTANRL